MSNTTEEKPARLRILQQNLNKSPTAHLDLINQRLSRDWDIILIQEPNTTYYGHIRTPSQFVPVHPSSRHTNDATVRSTIWVNSNLASRSWRILNILNNNDITAIQINAPAGRLSIFNIYNDCNHHDTLRSLNRYLEDNREQIYGNEGDSVMWCGDFNRHHPLWDDDTNGHLFTAKALRDAGKLIEMLAEWNMAMALPKGIPMLRHMVTKKHSRPDNVFCTGNLLDQVITCDTRPQWQPTKTDHYPIITTIELPTERTPQKASYNFRMADWEDFNANLDIRLKEIPEPQKLTTTEQFQQAVKDLTEALQDVIRTRVPESKPCLHSKRWWTKDLAKRKKELNKLSAEAYKYRAMPDHPAHDELRKIRNKYGDEITQAKTQHWADYLEEISQESIWTVNKYIAEPVGDGGRTRIPTLKVRTENGEELELDTNEAKAEAIAKSFFPNRPESSTVPDNYAYPEPLPDTPIITKERILQHLAKLSPYKASGPDEIPNVVLQKSANIIVEYLLYIYQAVFELKTYYEGWQESTTAILRKPGKPSYEVPKAYRPIALISCMSKTLTALAAEDVAFLTEKHQLLPQNHFGGRPKRSTTDAVHLLVHKIKSAWKRNKVASVIFLDIEGAFPNALTDRLIHNMKKRRVPTAYTDFIGRLLKNRQTRLRFDDFLSDPIPLNNGIGQGDPISMIAYTYYNADLLDLPETQEEEMIAFVDDAAAVVEGEDFDDTTRKIRLLMNRENGGFDWSTKHNSCFEISKLAVMHCTLKRQRDPDNPRKTIPLPRPALKLRDQVIQEVVSYKYLGIMVDRELKWKEQGQRTIAKATKWILMFRRLTKPTTGISAKYMRRLYLAVAVPKITYGADVWFTPPKLEEGRKQKTGTVWLLKQLTKAQRIATLAINGALRTTPTDLLDLHANILPMELILQKACHRATLRVCTLPDTHPLHEIIRKYSDNPTRKHPAPLQTLLRLFNIVPQMVEVIAPATRPPNHLNAFVIEIAATREESIKQEEQDDAEIKIFTDSSGYEGNAGAAAVMYRKGRNRPEKVLRYRLGSSIRYTNYEAEAIGILLALWMLQGQHVVGRLNVSIYTDSQAIAKSMRRPESTAGQYIVEEIMRQASAINSTEQRSKLKIRWISGHDGVIGNETADEEAKKAAQGSSSGTHRLPHLLRSQLPHSISALKQDFHSDLKEQWKKQWEKSPRHARMTKYDDTFPYTKFNKIRDKLIRKQASLLVQLRTGHIALNKYLHRIRKSDTNHCVKCLALTGQETPETTTHFLYECPAYNYERRDLEIALGRNATDTKTILASVKSVKKLLKYIGSTKRFQEHFGEVNTNQ